MTERSEKIGLTAMRLIEQVEWEEPGGKVVSVAVVALVETATDSPNGRILVASEGILEQAELKLPNDLEVSE